MRDTNTLIFKKHWEVREHISVILNYTKHLQSPQNPTDFPLHFLKTEENCLAFEFVFIVHWKLFMLLYVLGIPEQ